MLNVKPVFLVLPLASALLIGQAVIRRQSAPTTAVPGADNNTPSLKPGTVEGTVTNGLTGDPVKKANVTLRNMTGGYGYAAITDAAGRFLIEKVDPGSYQITAARDGFQPDQTLRRTALASPIRVAEEQHVKDLGVKLTPLGLVNGRVLDEDGDPIAGASILALRYVYASGRRELTPAGSANSNDLGEFQVLDIQPGRYYLQVTANQQRSAMVARAQALSGMAYPITYYPSALDVAQAAPVDIAAGAQRNGLDFQLRKTRAYRVRGKVVDQNGQLVRNVGVQVSQSGTASTPFARSFAAMQQDGSFEVLRLMSGTYVVSSQRQDAGVTLYGQQQINIADQDIDGVVLTLLPGFDLSGAVLLEGVPTNSANPTDPTKPQPQFRTQVALQPAERTGPGARAPVEADGTFVLHNVLPSRYEIFVATGPGKYLKSIRLGDRDLASGQMDLSQSAAGTLNLVMGTDGASIDGVVQNKDGEATAGMVVTVAPREGFESRRDLFKQTITGPNGRFRVQDIAPGNYQVFAWEDFDEMNSMAPEVRKAFESRAASLNVGANGRESVQLKSISAADVEREKSKLP